MAYPLEDRFLTINEIAFQAALNLAKAEGKPVGQVIEPFLAYAAPYSAPEEYLIYQVQPEDSLGSIARHFYGDGRKYHLLKKANNIAQTEEIWEGLILVIPPLEARLIPGLPSPSQAELDPDRLWTEAITLTSEPARVAALLEIVPLLPEALLREAWGAAYELEDEWEQSNLMAALALRLAEVGDSRAAFRLTGEIKRSWSQAKTLAQVVPYLPETLYPEALVLARTIPRPEDRVTALSSLARYLPEPQRRDLLAEAFANLELIEGEPLLAEAWAELVICFRELGYPPESFFPPEAADEALADSEEALPPAEPEPVSLSAGPGLPYLRRITLPGNLNPLWLAPLLILALCTVMLFTGSAVIGSVLFANRDQALDRVDLPSNGHAAISRVSLSRGQFYSIVVSGQFNYNVGQPESWADAQSSYYQRTGDWVPAYWISIDGQKVIAQQANPNEHLYVFYMQGNNRPVKFRIEERRETEYEDNRGSLQVTIYTGLVNLEEIQQ